MNWKEAFEDWSGEQPPADSHIVDRERVAFLAGAKWALNYAAEEFGDGPMSSMSDSGTCHRIRNMLAELEKEPQP